MDDVATDDLIAWCFDKTERPDLWADLHTAKTLLSEVIREFEGQYATRKAEYLAATRGILPQAEFVQVRADYENWKRRATRVRVAVVDRLRLVKQELTAKHAAERAAGPSNPVEHVDRIVGLARRLHGALGDFLAEYDTTPSDSGHGCLGPPEDVRSECVGR